MNMVKFIFEYIQFGGLEKLIHKEGEDSQSCYAFTATVQLH